MRCTPVYGKNLDAYLSGKYRVIINPGGTGSSKTYSILQLLYNIASLQKQAMTISIVSETLPHLKKGAIKDFQDIIINENIEVEKIHNKSDFYFNFGKCRVEYFSCDSPSKVRGPRRDILYMNEANAVSWEIFDQLLFRTNQIAFIDFNPVAEFWAHEHLSGRDDVLWINSTFRDNPYLPEPIINDLLLRKNNPNYANWWRVYGEGLTGMIEGLVYPYWQQVSSVPEGSALLGYGLDFGYTNDPTALIAIYKYQGEIYLHELIYQTGLLSSDIIRLMKQLKVSINRPIIADSADPRTIRELQLGGFNVRGVKKEHIYESIDFSKKYLKYVTKDSTNLIKELRNYMWLQKDGKFINEPINAYDHGCDAFRYGFLGLFSRAPIRYI